MTTVAIHQPQYLPWIPYVDKADQADIFVYLDNVQFHRRGVQNRNQIRGGQGTVWLTVPVSATRETRIDEVRIADQAWRKKHASSLRIAYARAAHAPRLQPLLALYDQPWDKLVDLNIAITEWLFGELGVRARRVRATELGALEGQKDDLLIAICRAVGATRYLSGNGARAYQDPRKFERANIDLVYQKYTVVPYPQQLAPFAGDLSAIDLVANTGPDARAVMLAGRQPPLRADEPAPTPFVGALAEHGDDPAVT